MTKLLAEHFQKGVQCYDTLATVQRDSAAFLVNYLQRIHPIQKRARVLDIGTGTGFMVQLLAQQEPDRHYMLNDICPEMLVAAAQKIPKNIEAHYYLGDARTLNFGPVDSMVSNLAFQWLDPLDEALAHLWPQTAVLAFSTLSANTFSQWRSLLRSYEIPCGLHRYLSIDALVKTCSALKARRWRYIRREVSQCFATPLDFMRHLKAIGAGMPTDHYSQAALFKIRQRTAPFIVTYDIFYAILIK